MTDLPLDTLRSQLARHVLDLEPADQVRVLGLMEAMKRGAEVDASTLQAMSPDELREWADQLSKTKG